MTGCPSLCTRMSCSSDGMGSGRTHQYLTRGKEKPIGSLRLRVLKSMKPLQKSVVICPIHQFASHTSEEEDARRGVW